MAKGLLKNYTFNTAAKTITLTDVTTVRLDKLALITDVTTNKILYNFADLTVATATVATNVITLSALQGGENNTDKLRIDYDVESSDTAAFADTTQPVSATSLPLPTGAATSALQSTQDTSINSLLKPASTLAAVTSLTQMNGQPIAMGTGVRSAGTQRVTIATDDVVPVTGTVTANAGTNLNTSALALDATLTGGTQRTKVTDGTNNAAVKAASTAAAATDPALVVAISPNNTVPVSLATNTPTLQSGSTTAVTQATGTNLHTVVDSGSITANIGTSGSLALDATLTGGTQQTKITDGTNVATVKAASTAAAAADKAVVVAVSPNNTVTTSQTDITATGNITTQNLVPAGTATANSAVQTANLTGMASASVQVTGTYTGALSAQGMVDGSTWVTLGGTPFLNINTGVYSATIASAATGIFQLDIAGFKQFRITGLAAMTGTATVTIQCSNGAGMVALDAPLPTGSNVIGALSANQSTNVAQINGVTPLMGNGVTGTGSPRVTLASNGTAISTAGYMSVKLDQTTAGTTNAVSLAQIGATTVVTGGVNGTLAVGGVTAAAATATGNPVRTGAIGKTANPTAVTDGQVANIITDKLGKQVVVGSIRDLKVNQITTITASTAETTVVTAVASTFVDVYGVVVVNSSATATNVSFKDSTAGTTRFNVYVPAGETRGFMLPESAAFAQTAVNSNWTATSSASVTSLIITMLGVKNT